MARVFSEKSRRNVESLCVRSGLSPARDVSTVWDWWEACSGVVVDDGASLGVDVRFDIVIGFTLSFGFVLSLLLFLDCLYLFYCIHFTSLRCTCQPYFPFFFAVHRFLFCGILCTGFAVFSYTKYRLRYILCTYPLCFVHKIAQRTEVMYGIVHEIWFWLNLCTAPTFDIVPVLSLSWKIELKNRMQVCSMRQNAPGLDYFL